MIGEVSWEPKRRRAWASPVFNSSMHVKLGKAPTCLYRVQYTQSGIATVWRTFQHDGKISPAWWGWGGCTSTPFHSIYNHLQSCGVCSSWEGWYTPPISTLPLYVLYARPLPTPLPAPFALWFPPLPPAPSLTSWSHPPLFDYFHYPRLCPCSPMITVSWTPQSAACRCSWTVKHPCSSHTLSTLEGKSHWCIPFLRIARPQTKFPHSVSVLYIPRNGPQISLQQNRQTDPANV
jgi:hypothetical protein